jgi:hypothetical protein
MEINQEKVVKAPKIGEEVVKGARTSGCETTCFANSTWRRIVPATNSKRIAL